MRESRTYGSVRGACDETHVPTATALQLRTRKRGPYGRNGAISRHFERDPIPYALGTDWLAGAAGLALLHLGIGIRQDSPAGARDSNLRISNC
jgi:hypothetical protein